ncbi:NAD-binding Rossmann fold oxidoreductase family protein [Penicillium canariense]|uniref:NAD-binding Rossmann fold oxidoreductase family protein n=1 Tax=Penicillium canariense TaxID=189055 RepID=A0A9W9HUB2_9EURO|nr:NAD-binding Rossmann fold oxidoreductase family protein [Penicillium canariense]KAJ5157606.1 NAD-binding Rossmann fold oxidoreductase family protein [Penicillium canariense]
MNKHWFLSMLHSLHTGRPLLYPKTVLRSSQTPAGCGGLRPSEPASCVEYSLPYSEGKSPCVISPARKDLDWANENLAQRGVHIYTFEEVIKIPNLEAVIIASPTTTHASQSLVAIQYGIHVLCETLVTINLDEFHGSRTRAQGYDHTTEIFNTIESKDQRCLENRVEISDSTGIQNEVFEGRMDLHAESSITKVNNFTVAIPDRTERPIKLDSALTVCRKN